MLNPCGEELASKSLGLRHQNWTSSVSDNPVLTHAERRTQWMFHLSEGCAEPLRKWILWTSNMSFGPLTTPFSEGCWWWSPHLLWLNWIAHSELRAVMMKTNTTWLGQVFSLAPQQVPCWIECHVNLLSRSSIFDPSKSMPGKIPLTSSCRNSFGATRDLLFKSKS